MVKFWFCMEHWNQYTLLNFSIMSIIGLDDQGPMKKNDAEMLTAK